MIVYMICFNVHKYERNSNDFFNTVSCDINIMI